MSPAKKGDNVKVHYTGKLDDGTVFDSSEGKAPLEFQMGESQVIPGFEDAVNGMNPGDKKTFKIPCDQAYGPRREDLVAQISKEQFPEHITLEIGQQLQIPQQEGQPLVVRITEITDEAVTLDANHPLAGEDLTFEIELIEAA
jgi:peptidylprolyl isomerase